MKRDHTSHSELKLERKCMRAWRYRYVERLERKQKARAPWIGTILHEMLDAFVMAKLDQKHEEPWDVHARYAKQYEKMFSGEKEEYGDIPLITEKVFEGYMRRWKGDGLRYEAVEMKIEVELIPGVTLLAYLDKVVRNKDGLRFIMDHKFHRILPGPEDRFSDIQSVLYLWGYNQVVPKKLRANGVLWDYGRMKMPAVPEVLKRGGLTQRKDIDTDAFTYRQTIEEHGLKVETYKDLLKKLGGRERTFFERVPLPSPSNALIERVVDDARQTASIRAKLGPDIAPRSMSAFNCKTCDFRKICEAEVRGLDAAFVRKRDYKIREHKDAKESKYEQD